MTSPIDQYRAWLGFHGLSADFADAQRWTLRRDHVYVPHWTASGGYQYYRRRKVGSRLYLNNKIELHYRSGIYYARPAIDAINTMECRIPIILTDSIIDAVYLQLQAAISGIQVQCISITTGYLPRLNEFPSYDGEQRTIYLHKSTDEALQARLEAMGAQLKPIQLSRHHSSLAQAIRQGESLTDLLNKRNKRTDRMRTMERNAITTASQVMSVINDLPRSIYTLRDLHRIISGTGIQIGKLQLSALLKTQHPQPHARRHITIDVKAVEYRANRTTKGLTLICIRQLDYWHTSSDKQWIAESEGRYNTRHQW